MNRRLFLKSAAILGALIPLMGFAVQQAPMPAWVPGHIENNDPNWGILNGAQTSIDEARGVMTAQFTDMIRHMDGQTVTIGGFILPLDSQQQFSHFVLTRRNSGCPFCPPNLPTEAVEVFATAPVRFDPNEFAATGRFQIIQSTSEGLFYRLNNARVRQIS